MSDRHLICVALTNDIVVIGDLVQETDKAIAITDAASVHHVKENPKEGIEQGSIVVSEVFPSCINLTRPVAFSYDQVVATFAPSDILLSAYEDWCSNVLNMTEDDGAFDEQ